MREVLEAIIKGQPIEEKPDFIALAKFSMANSVFHQIPATLESLHEAGTATLYNDERQPRAIRKRAKALRKEVTDVHALGFLDRIIRGEDVYKLFDEMAEFVWQLTLKVASEYERIYDLGGGEAYRVSKLKAA